MDREMGFNPPAAPGVPDPDTWGIAPSIVCTAGGAESDPAGSTRGAHRLS
jgi:hypothetical protein